MREVFRETGYSTGRPVLQLPELLRVLTGPEILASHLECVCREWLLRHPDIDAVVLTQPRLCLDEFGIPYILNLENRVVTSYVAPGWAIKTLIVPVPCQGVAGSPSELGG